jgi:hypothetical protein
MRMGYQENNNEEVFEIILHSLDPALRVTPKLANLLFCFEKINFYDDFFVSNYFMLGEDAYIDPQITDDEVSLPGWAPFFGIPFENWLSKHPNGIKQPPIYEPNKMAIVKYNVHPSEGFIKAYKRFCDIWKAVNFKKNAICDQEYKLLLDEIARNRLETAVYFSEKKDLPIVSDMGSLLSVPEINTKSLSQLLAIESVAIVMPKVNTLDLDLIMELRYKLRDFLPSFWRELRKLSFDLKVLIGQEASPEIIQKEAKFIVDSRVEPHLEELRQKAKERKDKIIRKVLGATLETVTIALDFGTTALYKVFAKMFGKATNQALAIEDSLTKKNESDIQSFLFRLETEIKKIDG